MNAQMNNALSSYLESLQTSDWMFFHQQFYVLHFHAVHVQSVPEWKLWKLATPLPNSKIFRGVSDVLFSSQYHGIVDSRCFGFVSRNLWLSVPVHLKASLCLISFSSECAWVLVAAMAVTPSYLRVATCLNIHARAFKLLMIYWWLDLLPQAECSGMKINSSFTIDLENWELLLDVPPLSTMWILLQSIPTCFKPAEHL